MLKISNYFINDKNFYLKILSIFIAGFLAGLVFVKIIFFPLAILAFNYLYYSITARKISLLKSFFIGIFFGTGKFLSSLYWIANSFEMADYGGIQTGFIAVLLLCIFLSVFVGASCAISKCIINYWKLNNIRSVLIFSCILSFGEYFRGEFLGGFPWNIIGYIWANSYLTLQGISWLGIYGLGLLTYLAIFSLSLIKKNLKYSLYLIFPLFFVMIFSLFRILIFSESQNSGINTKIVQPSIPQKEKLNRDLHDEHLNKLVNLSYKNKNKDLNIIVWPESAVHFDIEKNNKKRKEVFSFIKKEQILITGATRRQFSDNSNKNMLTKIYNSIFIIGENSEIHGYYDKKHLVPFGEFIPLRDYLKIDNIVGSNLDFSAGKKSNFYVLPQPFPKVALMVCYEIIFPGKIIKGSRPDIIINLTNDAWYGDTAGPQQHLKLARARAVEEGISIVRAANTGISAIIDPYGRYIHKLGFYEEGTIEAFVPYKIKPTFFSKYGNLPFIIISFFILFLGRFLKN